MRGFLVLQKPLHYGKAGEPSLVLIGDMFCLRVLGSIWLSHIHVYIFSLGTQ